MYGCPVGVSITLSKSPRVMQKVIINTRPNAPLMNVVQIMVLGICLDASLSSSDMWTAASAPNNGIITARMPIRAEVASLFQPPKLLNVVKTAAASPRGPRTQRVTITAKKPKTWIMRTIPSIKGSFFARKVLKKTENEATAQVRSVPCHRW
jgi:hypothetical protein